MNLKARHDWLMAVRRSCPRLKFKRLERRLATMDRLGGVYWEAGLCGLKTFEKIAFRVFGENPYEPLEGLTWNARLDQPERIDRPGSVQRPPRPAQKARRRERPFSPAALGDPALRAAFSDFLRLCPVSGMRTESLFSGGEYRQASWSLRLKTPLPWPLFQRLDLAAPFTADSCRLAFLLLDRGVTELVFQGDELWVYCG